VIEPLAARTKIVGTIGPASQAQDAVERMIAAGMNVARINFAHGDFQSHAKTIATVRDSAGKVGRRVAVLGDLPGPQAAHRPARRPARRARAGSGVHPGGRGLRRRSHRASTTFEGLPRVVKRGDTIFLNDGMIQLEVREVTDREVRCTVAVGGPLLSHKGINVPDVGVDGSQPPADPGRSHRRCQRSWMARIASCFRRNRQSAPTPWKRSRC
jgi:pyruvate kinase